MRIGRRSKSEQMALSRNSRNASRNTQTPMGSGFYILVPTVPTQNQYLNMRARKIFCSPPTKNFSPYTHGVSRKKVGKSEQTPETTMGSGFPCSDSCSDCSDCADSQRLGVVRDDRSGHHRGHHAMAAGPGRPRDQDLRRAVPAWVA